MYVYFSIVHCDSVGFFFFFVLSDLVSKHSMTIHSCILFEMFVFGGSKNNKSCYLICCMFVFFFLVKNLRNLS